MLNLLIVTGRAGGPAERRAAGPRQVLGLRLAVGQGEGKPTLWIDVTVWGDKAPAWRDLEGAGKGDRVTVQGRLGLREWTTQSGEARSSLTLDCDRAIVERRQEATPEPRPSRRDELPPSDDPDADIPF